MEACAGPTQCGCEQKVVAARALGQAAQDQAPKGRSRPPGERPGSCGIKQKGTRVSLSPRLSAASTLQRFPLGAVWSEQQMTLLKGND